MGTHTVEEPWAVVASDLMEPLPKSNKGHQYILIFLDLFTKWVKIIPLRTANGKSISQHFRNLIYRWGAPSVLLTDNGNPYVNKNLQRLAELHGIQTSTTPVYHPQANPDERINRTVKTMITSFIKDNHKEWDQFLPEFMFGINTALQESTGFSPAVLNLGRELKICITYRGSIEKEKPIVKRSISSWVARFPKLKEIIALVQRNKLTSLDKQTHCYNLRRRPCEFKVGDQELRKAHPLSSAAKQVSSKLVPKYEGPWSMNCRS